VVALFQEPERLIVRLRWQLVAIVETAHSWMRPQTNRADAITSEAPQIWILVDRLRRDVGEVHPLEQRVESRIAGEGGRFHWRRRCSIPAR
jgi:hypothetical protein